jgi:ABC-2 type transport system ATP-binding protein
MQTVIRIENLTVRYGHRLALDGLSVDIAPGVVGLLGPNGAGKSTLLKTLLGFIEPAGGHVEVLGEPVRPHRAEPRARIGYLPERNAFIPGLSAVESVALAGEAGGLPRMSALERAHDVLSFAGLGDARYRRIDDFSTGMLQRTKLATSLVHDPDLVLLDEPTSGTDPAGRRHLIDLVRQLSRNHGISVLLSTHLLHDVEAVCDRVVALKKGKLVMSGHLRSLKRTPGWIYEVRARETEPGRFARALVSRGLEPIPGRDGTIRVSLPEPDGRILFEAALASGAELRHLRRFESSLEELFLTAVDEGD